MGVTLTTDRPSFWKYRSKASRMCCAVRSGEVG